MTVMLHCTILLDEARQHIYVALQQTRLWRVQWLKQPKFFFLKKIEPVARACSD